MPKISYLDNARRQGLRLFYVYYHQKQYGAIDASDKTKSQAIALLPDGSNFIMQQARNIEEAIALVKDQRAEDLLQSPTPA